MDALLDALRAVAEHSRLRLLAVCASAEFSVSELTRILGQSQPRVSRHLKLLTDAGLLERYQEQTFVYYHTARSGLGGRLAAHILDLLNDEDETIRLDRKRVADVLALREAEAERILANLDPTVMLVTAGRAGDQQVAHTLQSWLADHPYEAMLDIGTGTGRMLALLGNGVKRAVGIDISTDMLRVARAKLHQAGLGHVSLRKGDMYRLDFADESFDLVTIDHVLSQAENPLDVVCEAVRLLKKGGRLVTADFLEDAEPAAKEEKPTTNTQDLDAWFQAANLSLQEREVVRLKQASVILSLAVKTSAAESAA